jgi:hypothetical protein
VARYRVVAVIGLVLIGVLVGSAAAGVAFAYDGRHPVNLFRLLGLLVLVPGLLLMATLLLLVVRPGRLGGSAGGPLAALNAGRWAGAMLDRIAGLELFAPAAGAPLGLAGFARWQVTVFSQWAALGFFLGVLGYALLLIAFTDLAFGWSTTLALDPAAVHRLFAALALPWSGWLPQAVPDPALTEVSRYFRGEAPVLAAERAERLGAWWPFVLATVLVYGLLPRLLLLGWSAWRLRRATRLLLCRDAEVAALLDRLATPVVAPGGDGTGVATPLSAREVPAPLQQGVRAEALIVIWNGAMRVEAARTWLMERLGLQAAATFETGAAQSGEEQRAALARALAAYPQAARGRLVVVTRGWEPPLLEFADFLGLVRELAGNVPTITVVPIDVSGTRVESADRAVWSRTLARLRDPGLYVQEAVE